MKQQYQIGGWYNGRQWNGTSFGAPGQITVGEAAGTMVNPVVVAASNKAQGLAPGTNEAFLSMQGSSTSSESGGGESGGGEINPYDAAASNLESKIPLIQQRYKTLLDEIDRATQEGAQAQEKATTSQIGETQARAAASGIFSGSTELGTESIIRKQAADTIASIKQSGASKKAQAVAQEAIDIGEITDKLMNLAIAKDKANRDAAQFALEYILKQRQLAIDETKANKSGSDDFLKFVQTQAGSYKATAQQEKDANSASSGLDALTTIRTILKSKDGEAAKAMWNRGVITAVAGGSAARQYRDAAKEAYDALMRTRTGAALNMSEEAFYAGYIPTYTDDSKTTEAKLVRLENIYNKTIDETKNPYQDYLDKYAQQKYGLNIGTTTIGGTGNDPLGIR